MKHTNAKSAVKSLEGRFAHVLVRRPSAPYAHKSYSAKVNKVTDTFIEFVDMNEKKNRKVRRVTRNNLLRIKSGRDSWGKKAAVK